MMATVRHVTSSSGLRKFQADGFLLDRMYLLIADQHGRCRLVTLIGQYGLISMVPPDW